jgi:hypothetical protein
MLRSEDLALCFVEDLESPKELFQMVMDYAKRCKKNEWKCFGEAFSPNKITLIIKEEKGDYFGYICAEITEENDLFVYHGFITEPLQGSDKLLDNMISLIQWKHNRRIRNVMIESDMEPRLWKKWGFEVSPTKIYIKKVSEEK